MADGPPSPAKRMTPGQATSATTGVAEPAGPSAIAPRGTNAIDLHVGARVRARRVSLGMRQEDLAAAIGLTFQQVQNLETGVRRVFAGRLYDLARALGVPVGFFFEGMAPQHDTNGSSQGHRNQGLGRLRETRDLMRSYSSIAQPNVRRRILALIKNL